MTDLPVVSKKDQNLNIIVTSALNGTASSQEPIGLCTRSFNRHRNTAKVLWKINRKMLFLKLPLFLHGLEQSRTVSQINKYFFSIKRL